MDILRGPYCSNVLVLGGTGFIGSRLVAQLAAQGRCVTLPTLTKHTASSPGCSPNSVRSRGDDIACPLVSPAP